MHHCLHIAFAISAAVTFSSPALAAAEPEPALKRTSKWVMEYADSACNLSATFGTEPKQVIARFAQVAPESVARITLYSSRFGSRPELSSRAKIFFLPTTEKVNWMEVENGTTARADGKGKIPTLFVGALRLDNRTATETGPSELPPVTRETEQAVTGLSVAIRSAKPFILDFGSMGPPMTAMRKCTDNLVRHWGFDPGELASRQQRVSPTSNPATWLTSGDYPNGMLFDGASAFVTFRLAVDETGAVTDCFVLETTNPPTIGPHTCATVKKRARFTPSRNKDGKPVPDFYINRVFWRATL